MKKGEAFNALSMTPAEYVGSLIAGAPFACTLVGSFALVGYTAVQTGHIMYDLYEQNEAEYRRQAIQEQAKELAQEMLNAQKNI